MGFTPSRGLKNKPERSYVIYHNYKLIYITEHDINFELTPRYSFAFVHPIAHESLIPPLRFALIFSTPHVRVRLGIGAALMLGGVAIALLTVGFRRVGSLTVRVGDVRCGCCSWSG
jgi:hypothetical protein